MKWRLNNLGIFVFLIFCFTFLNAFLSYALFPKHINLLEGTEFYLDYNKNLSATIEPETISVIKVNNKKVEDNININLKETVTLNSSEVGTAQMTLNAFGLPVKRVTLDVIPNIEVIPYGKTVGVRVDINGIMVLGTGVVNSVDGKKVNPSENILKPGDLILKVNGVKLKNKEDLTANVDKNDKINLEINRNETIMQVSVTPVKSMEDNKNKIGVWVRDSTQGIGTITYYNPSNNKFAALGHGILDIDTKQLMKIKNGDILGATVSNVVKGEKGNPGELIGNIQNQNILGEVKSNTNFGVYGYWSSSKITDLPKEKFAIGLQDQVHEGPAIIKSNIENGTVENYDVYIESVNRYSSDDSKGMVVRITDPKLLAKTNGIVQGMSGSPIIQGEKLIGAVTHVFVQDSTKGYGIFIENMLKQEKLI